MPPRRRKRNARAEAEAARYRSWPLLSREEQREPQLVIHALLQGAACLNLTPIQQLVLFHLVFGANDENSGGLLTCRMWGTGIAAELSRCIGKSPRMVQLAIRDLKKRGLISIRRSKSWQGMPGKYTRYDFEPLLRILRSPQSKGGYSPPTEWLPDPERRAEVRLGESGFIVYLVKAWRAPDVHVLDVLRDLSLPALVDQGWIWAEHWVVNAVAAHRELISNGGHDPESLTSALARELEQRQRAREQDIESGSRNEL